MDGLLIDSEPLWDQAEVEVTESLGWIPAAAMNCPTCLVCESTLWWICGMPSSRGTASIAQKPPRALSAGPSSWWKPHARCYRAYAEAVALCKAQGLKVGLASASPLVMLEKVLNMFELRDQFDALASAEHLPWSKPHPQVYLNCAAALGVDPQRCVALEDSVNGMIASKAARMRAIVVPEAENSRDPRFVLADVKLPSLQALTAEALLG
ncbi:hexitol phosphatase HxpB [Klebsiella variicola subsp. variicola]|nr:hexitol phosphatase HxpB [Klebsiella variicola subsp. variicola]